MKKELYLPYFKDKKITVMGIGVLGRGVGDISFLASCGSDIIATDKKNADDLINSVEILKKFKNITFRLGEHRLDDFENRDYVLKAAGVPLDSEFIYHAKESHVPVFMSAALLVKIVKEIFGHITVIGITGTRGKSTTTHLVEHILTSSGKKVHVGGNVRGVANLPLLDQIEDGDILLFELDSWQLQGFGDLKISPDIAVFTSFLDDHLNYYKGDKELYFKDKANIFLNQREGGVCVLSRQVKDELDNRGISCNTIIPEIENVKTNIIGKHNQVLISLAVEVANRCGINRNDVIKNLESFKAVNGRLEYVGDFSGKKVFNDNNATTGDATVVAIRSIVETFQKKPVVIVGGADKNLSLTELESELSKNAKEVVYLSGTGTDRISLEKKNEFEDLRDCIDKAFSITDDGDIILFSPGFASFSKYFKNEYERNDFFMSYIIEKFK